MQYKSDQQQPTAQVPLLCVSPVWNKCFKLSVSGLKTHCWQELKPAVQIPQQGKGCQSRCKSIAISWSLLKCNNKLPKNEATDLANYSNIRDALAHQFDRKSQNSQAFLESCSPFTDFQGLENGRSFSPDSHKTFRGFRNWRRWWFFLKYINLATSALRMVKQLQMYWVRSPFLFYFINAVISSSCLCCAWFVWCLLLLLLFTNITIMVDWV